MEPIILSKKQSSVLGVILILVAFLLFVYAVHEYLPVHTETDPPYSMNWGIDWKGNIRLGSLDLIAGHTPYTSVIRCLPPWIYLLVSPIAILPNDIGSAVLFVLTYMVYSFVLYRLKVNPWAIFAFILSAHIFKNAVVGNLDFLVALGFILPPQIGLFLVLIKPQMGMGIAIYWLVEAWRKGRLVEILRIYTPVALAYAISFLIYGLWPLKFRGMTNDSFNASLWPVGIPLGIFMLYKSLRDRNIFYAIGSSPFLSPYVNSTSYAVVSFPFFSYTFFMFAIAALSWV